MWIEKIEFLPSYPESIKIRGNLDDSEGWDEGASATGTDGVYVWSNVRLTAASPSFRFGGLTGSTWNDYAPEESATTAVIGETGNNVVNAERSWNIATGNYRMTLDLVNNKLTIVNSVPVSSITIASAGGATLIRNGETLQFSVTSVLPSDAADKTVTWHSSNEGVATVDATGLVTAHATATGTTTIYATANDGSDVNSNSITLTVAAPLKTMTGKIRDWWADISDLYIKGGTRGSFFPHLEITADGTTYNVRSEDDLTTLTTTNGFTVTWSKPTSDAEALFSLNETTGRVTEGGSSNTAPHVTTVTARIQKEGFNDLVLTYNVNIGPSTGTYKAFDKTTSWKWESAYVAAHKMLVDFYEGDGADEYIRVESSFTHNDGRGLWAKMQGGGHIRFKLDRRTEVKVTYYMQGNAVGVRTMKDGSTTELETALSALAQGGANGVQTVTFTLNPSGETEYYLGGIGSGTGFTYNGSKYGASDIYVKSIEFTPISGTVEVENYTFTSGHIGSSKGNDFRQDSDDGTFTGDDGLHVVTSQTWNTQAGGDLNFTFTAPTGYYIKSIAVNEVNANVSTLKAGTLTPGYSHSYDSEGDLGDYGEHDITLNGTEGVQTVSFILTAPGSRTSKHTQFIVVIAKNGTIPADRYDTPTIAIDKWGNATFTQSSTNVANNANLYYKYEVTNHNDISKDNYDAVTTDASKTVELPAGVYDANHIQAKAVFLDMWDNTSVTSETAKHAPYVYVVRPTVEVNQNGDLTVTNYSEDYDYYYITDRSASKDFTTATITDGVPSIGTKYVHGSTNLRPATGEVTYAAGSLQIIAIRKTGSTTIDGETYYYRPHDDADYCMDTKVSARSITLRAADATYTVEDIQYIKIGPDTYSNYDSNNTTDVSFVYNETANVYEFEAGAYTISGIVANFPGGTYYGDPSTIEVKLTDDAGGDKLTVNAPVDVEGETAPWQRKYVQFVYGGNTYRVFYRVADIQEEPLDYVKKTTTWKFEHTEGWVLGTWTCPDNITFYGSQAEPIRLSGNRIDTHDAGSMRISSVSIKIGGPGTLTFTGYAKGGRTITIKNESGTELGSVAIGTGASESTKYHDYDVSWNYTGTEAQTLYIYVSNANSYINMMTWEPVPFFDHVFYPAEFKKLAEYNTKFKSNKNTTTVTVGNDFFKVTKNCNFIQKGKHPEFNLAHYNKEAADEIPSHSNCWVFNFGGAGNDTWNFLEGEFTQGARSIEFTPVRNGKLYAYVHSTAYQDSPTEVANRSLIMRDITLSKEMGDEDEDEDGNKYSNNPKRGDHTSQYGNYMSMFNVASGDAKGTVTEVVFNCKAGRKYSLASCSSGLYLYYLGYHHQDDLFAKADADKPAYATIAEPVIESKSVGGVSRKLVITQATPATGQQYKTFFNHRVDFGNIECVQGGFAYSSSELKAQYNAVDGQDYDALTDEMKEEMTAAWTAAANKTKAYMTKGSPTAENEIYSEDSKNIIFDITEDAFFRAVTINTNNNELMQATAARAGVKGVKKAAATGTPIYDSRFVDFAIIGAPVIGDAKYINGAPADDNKRASLTASSDYNAAVFGEEATKTIEYYAVCVDDDPGYDNLFTLKANGMERYKTDDAAALFTNTAVEGAYVNLSDGTKYPAGSKVKIYAVTKIVQKDGGVFYSFPAEKTVKLTGVNPPEFNTTGCGDLETKINSTYKFTESGVHNKDNIVVYYTIDGTIPEISWEYDDEQKKMVVTPEGSTAAYDMTTQPAVGLTQTGAVKAINVNKTTGDISEFVTKNLFATPGVDGFEIPDVQELSFNGTLVVRKAKYNDSSKNDLEDGKRSSKATFVASTLGKDESDNDILTSSNFELEDAQQIMYDNEPLNTAEKSDNYITFQAYPGSLVKVIAMNKTNGMSLKLQYVDNSGRAKDYNAVPDKTIAAVAMQAAPNTYYARIPADANPGTRKMFYLDQTPGTKIYFVGVYHTEHTNWNQWTFTENAKQGDWDKADCIAYGTGYWAYNASLPEHTNFHICDAVDESKLEFNVTPYDKKVSDNYQVLPKKNGTFFIMTAPSEGKAYYVNESLAPADKVDDMVRKSTYKTGDKADAIVNRFDGTDEEDGFLIPFRFRYLGFSYHGFYSFGPNKDKEVTGFTFYYMKDGKKAQRNKAFIELSSSYVEYEDGKSAPGFRIVYNGWVDDYGYGDGETTGIGSVEAEETIVDVNSQSGAIYNLSGQKLDRITMPGIYIVNGKKVLVK